MVSQIPQADDGLRRRFSRCDPQRDTRELTFRRRRTVTHVQERLRVSERRACRVLGQNRAVQRYGIDISLAGTSWQLIERGPIKRPPRHALVIEPLPCQAASGPDSAIAKSMHVWNCASHDEIPSRGSADCRV